ncbi:Uncharacterized protein GBIM_09175, partial [Gryllus bimaculatus]
PTTKPTPKPTTKPTPKPTTKPNPKPTPKPTSKPTTKPTIKPTTTKPKTTVKPTVQTTTKKSVPITQKPTTTTQRSTTPKSTTPLTTTAKLATSSPKLPEVTKFSPDSSVINVATNNEVARLHSDSHLGNLDDSILLHGLLQAASQDVRRPGREREGELADKVIEAALQNSVSPQKPIAAHETVVAQPSQKDLTANIQPQQRELAVANKVIEMALEKTRTSSTPPTTVQPSAQFLDLVALLQKNTTPRRLNSDEQFLAALLGANLRGTTTKPKTTTSKLSPEEQLLAALLNPQLQAATTTKTKSQNNAQTLSDAQFLATLLAANSPRPNNKAPVAKATSPAPIFPQLQGANNGFINPSAIDLEGVNGSAGGQRLVKAAIEVTKAVSQFMNVVIQGASQSFQSFFTRGTNLLGNYFSWGSLQSSAGS